MNNEITINRTSQKRVNNTWIDTYTDTDVTSVYKSLASDIIQKKLNSCKYIKSIKRIQKYDHVEIVITYDNNVRNIYTLPTHSF